MAETAREEKAGSSGVKPLPRISVRAASDIRCTMPDATLWRLIIPTKMLLIEITTHLTALFCRLNCGFANISRHPLSTTARWCNLRPPNKTIPPGWRSHALCQNVAEGNRRLRQASRRRHPYRSLAWRSLSATAFTKILCLTNSSAIALD